MNGKPIRAIVTLELHTYADFCRWLRKDKNTSVVDLIKETDDVQAGVLSEFLDLFDLKK